MSDTPFLWNVEVYPEVPPAAPVVSRWRVGMLCLGAGLTAAVMAAAWMGLQPATRVDIRIVAEGGRLAGRAALAEAALRLGLAPNRSALLAENGQALIISAEEDDPALSYAVARSGADAVLNSAGSAAQAPPPLQPALAPRSPRGALSAERDRLLAMSDALEARASSVSAALTGVVRDLAAGARSAADRRPGRETLDKAAASLADLQLQRIQLASRYQDDYPAIGTLDMQIRNMRTFLADETRRVEAAGRTLPDPGDTLLTAERDRLRTELSQLGDRRTQVATDLAAAARQLTALPPDQAEPAPAPAPAPGPVLLEGATAVATLPDRRWTALPAIAIGGILLTVLAWFVPRTRRLPMPAETLRRLDRADAARLPHSRPGAPLPAPWTNPSAAMLHASVDAADGLARRPRSLKRV